MRDLVIIGSGPAGLSAAVYGKRAMLDEVVIEKEPYSGGQIVITERIDNYLGEFGVNGYELAMKFREHADELGVPFMDGTVVGITDKGEYKIVKLDNGDEIETKNVIIATGAGHRKLDVKGEDEYKGAGVSYCATCDGAFFKDREVAVIGGGDVALGDAIYLSNVCKKVYLIHRREDLRGSKALQQKIFDAENIEFIPYAEVKEISGNDFVESITITDNRTSEDRVLDVEGVFVAVGMEPQSKAFKDVVKTDEAGYIIADESCKTGTPGIYVAGDIRTKQVRQIVTAVADGAVAIKMIG